MASICAKQILGGVLMRSQEFLRSRNFEAFAGLETRDTAGLETCATSMRFMG